jgi:hypothetical protein
VPSSAESADPTTAAGTFGAVITLNGNDYRLVLLDTNALSEFAKQGDGFRHFLTWSSAQPMFVPCFSLFSVLEMRRRPDVTDASRSCSAYCPACS